MIKILFDLVVILKVRIWTITQIEDNLIEIAKSLKTSSSLCIYLSKYGSHLLCSIAISPRFIETSMEEIFIQECKIYVLYKK